MAVNDLLLRIGINPKGINKGLKDAERAMKKAGARLERIGRDLSLRVSAPIAAIGVSSIRTFAQFDKLEKGLTAITGSASEANRQFGSLLDVVKDTRTTLDLRTAATGALQLQAVGLAAKDVENTLRQLGIAATLAGSSSDDVGEVARQLSQAAAKGNILQQELRIILERIPSLAAVIKNEFGTVTAEGLRAAGVSADQFIKRLTAAIETNEKFQNVQGGISKAIETFGINLQIAGAELGKTISETIGLEKALNTVSNVISSVVKGFAELSPNTKTAILGITGLAASIGPLSLGIGALLKALPLLRAGFVALTGPVGLITIALGALATAFLLYQARTTAAAKAQAELNGVNVTAEKSIARERVQVNRLVDALKDENTTKAGRLSAIKNLQAISPKYFSGLDAEKSKTEDITKASEKYIQSLLQRAKLQAANERLIEIEKQLLDISQQAEEAKPSFLESFANAAFSGGNAVTFLNKQTSSFTGNLEANKKALEASRDALLDFLKERETPEITRTITTDTAKKTTETAGVDSGVIESLKQTDVFARTVRENIGLITEAFNSTQQAFTGGIIAPDAINEFKPQITEISNLLGQYGDKLRQIEADNINFATVQDVLNAKITTTREAITAATAEFGAESSEVQFLIEQLRLLGEQFDAVARSQQLIGAGANAAANAFQTAADSQEKGLKGLAKAAKQAAREFIKTQLAEAIAAQAKNLIAQFGIFGIPLAIGGAAAVGALFSKIIPAFGDGAVINGPTLALLGEKGETEYVVPKSDMASILGGAGAQELSVRIEGEDLYFLLQRVEKTLGRIG